MAEQRTSSKEQPHGHGHLGEPSRRLFSVGVALVLILVFYGFLLYQGLPQQWTEISNAAYHEDVLHGQAEKYGGKHDGIFDMPPYYMIAPFAILLICLAVLPLIPATVHFWENNTNKFIVGSILGALTLLYYYAVCDFFIEQHWPDHKMVDPAEIGGFGMVKTVFINAIVYEFLPFIVLLFSLFTIAGGIRIFCNLKATPFVNTAVLFIGAFLASFIGTTGAAMLLIRPLLDINRHRKYKVHTIVFFIFCVCNCGGCLTPLGDPPLFLGYLLGVAFVWTLFALWPMWAFVNVSLVVIYFLWDTVWFYRRESQEYWEQKCEPGRKLLSISGWQLNVPLLLGVIAAIALLDPSRKVIGTDWYPCFYLREAIQLGLAAISLFFSSAQIRKENVFNFLAIGEVAALFFGIFICMQAPLQIMHVKGNDVVAATEKATGLNKEKLFFWTTGSLGSVLDNAPTYVVFFETAKVLTPETPEEKEKWRQETGREFIPVPIKGGYIDHYLLIAVSLGAVFMGALTYIGNAPNFLIKAVAEQDGVEMPSFFGFMAYSCFILLPVIVLMAFIFLYNPV